MYHNNAVDVETGMSEVPPGKCLLRLQWLCHFGAGSRQLLISACHLTLRCPGSIKTYQQIALEGPSIASLLATIENLRLVKMRFSAFCAHLNKSYGAKHVMHGGDAETFIGALVSISLIRCSN
jgi:hypothetical protein